MLRIFTASALVAALGTAPMQCRREPEPELRREDSAGDAIYALAEDFRQKGDEPAAERTLRFLVERYPSNRHVPAARAELAGRTSDARTDAGK
jgi:hypothetical protein